MAKAVKYKYTIKETEVKNIGIDNVTNVGRTHLLICSGPCQDNGQQDFAICSCL